MIWFVVCSDHTLKRLVRAAYESSPGRKRLFHIPDGLGGMQPFTWQAIVAVWTYDQTHKECRRTPLRRDAVFRDGFSDLRVWVATAVLHPRVLASLKTIYEDLARSPLPAEQVGDP